MIIILRQQIKALVEIISGAITQDDIHSYLLLKIKSHIIIYSYILII